MKAKFVLPALLAMMLVGCNKNEGGKNPPSPPTPGQYSVTVVFNNFAASAEERKASDAAAAVLLTNDINAKMVKSNGDSLITAVSYGDALATNAVVNTQITEVGYEYDGATTVSKRWTLTLGTSKKGGELHFTFVDKLVKVKIYANAYYSWGDTYNQVRDKSSTMTVNSGSMSLTQINGNQPLLTEPDAEVEEFAIDSKQLDIKSETPTTATDNWKKRVVFHKMEFTFQEEE